VDITGGACAGGALQFQAERPCGVIVTFDPVEPVHVLNAKEAFVRPGSWPL
jgi:hypothetical protein